MADLGPHSSGSCSSSLVPYATEEDSNPEEDQEQQRRTPEQMETEEPAMMEAPAKEGIGIAVGLENYQPAPPRYVRADKDSEDEEGDQNEGEDIEAPCLAPRLAPPPNPSQDEKPAQTPSKVSQTPAEDLQESSGEESILELIDLRKEEVPPPSPPKRAQRLPVSSFPPLKDHIRTLPDAAPEIHPEEVPEEQIIYIDDDVDPSPLQLLERQVDSLLMPPPSDTTPVAQKTSRSLGRGIQLYRMPERERCSPSTTGKKTLQER